MSRSKKPLIWIFYGFFLSIWIFPLDAATPISTPVKKVNMLRILTESWSPLTSQEQLEVASYLQQQTEAYLEKVEIIVLLIPEEDSSNNEIQIYDPRLGGDSLDTQLAELFELRVTNLQSSLKEMTETLKLIRRTIQEFPAEYVQTAPLLWLTIVKVLSTEKDNAINLVDMDFTEVVWPRTFELVLPRIFTRILEPRINELLRVLRKESIILQAR